MLKVPTLKNSCDVSCDVIPSIFTSLDSTRQALWWVWISGRSGINWIFGEFSKLDFRFWYSYASGRGSVRYRV